MEDIEVPQEIPKAERHLFRDALVASHAGKMLAGLYLRTFIEQFARRQTGKTADRATGDEIMDAYATLLPQAQRDQMPSLKHWYDRLSEALHAARADERLFEEALADIDRHFDMRRVFRIADAGHSKSNDEACGLISH